MRQSQLQNLSGRLWSEVSEELRPDDGGAMPLQVLVVDITPERTPRTPTQQFGWGELRVVRAHLDGAQVTVTVACEMKLAPESA